MTEETWEDLFSLFENQYVLVNIESDTVTIQNLVVFLTRITEDDRLVCLNEDGESITLEKTPVQPV